MGKFDAEELSTTGEENGAVDSDGITTSATFRPTRHTNEENGGNLRNLPISSSSSLSASYYSSDSSVRESESAAEYIECRAAVSSAFPSYRVADAVAQQVEFVSEETSFGSNIGGRRASGYFRAVNAVQSCSNQSSNNINIVERRIEEGSSGSEGGPPTRRPRRRRRVHHNLDLIQQQRIYSRSHRKDRLLLWMRELELTWLQITLLISEFLWFLKNHGIPRYSFTIYMFSLIARQFTYKLGGPTVPFLLNCGCVSTNFKVDPRLKGQMAQTLCTVNVSLPSINKGKFHLFFTRVHQLIPY